MPSLLSRFRRPHLTLPSYLTLPTVFLTGILLTLSLPSLTPYFRPYLPFLYRSWRARPSDRNAVAGAGLRRGIEMVDTESEPEMQKVVEGAGEERQGKGDVEGRETIGEGLESCVGHTPLFRIRSLSEETGCEILGKAEFMNGGGGSPKDRVALSMIRTVRCCLYWGRHGVQRR